MCPYARFACSPGEQTLVAVGSLNTLHRQNAAPTSEEQMLMEEWRTRRAAEVLRRSVVPPPPAAPSRT
jgi:hypothetical protein